MVAHVCNSNYMRGEVRRIVVQGQHEKNVVRIYLKEQARHGD
jgi:hypothetical protein